jgi:RNA polymerase sigma-70 factor (ECF subfamily)
LWKHLQKKPPAAVIVLFYREEKSIEDIAQILEMPPNTVKTHLHRGRKELYHQLRSIWESEYVRK